MLDRRGFLGAGAAFSALALTDPARAQMGNVERYGMIEIGSSGVKVNAYRFVREMIVEDEATGPSGRERFAPSRIGKGYTVNTSVITGNDKDIEETIQAAKTAVERLISAEFGVPKRNIAIVASSGVATLPAALEKLGAGVQANTGITMDSISPREEAQLAFDWVVLGHRRQQVLMIDVGSGNTKGGYYEQVGTPQQRFRDFSVPLGTKSFANAIRRSWPTDPVLARADSIFESQYLPILNEQLASAPGLLNKPRVYFSGGIFWATSLLVRPMQMASKANWVRLRADDFDTLGKMIQDGDPYGFARKTALPVAQADWLGSQLTAVAETFNADQLAAGNALCRSMARRLEFAGRSALFFASFAVDSWSSQYLVRKFRAEAA
ncbi:MAG: hypothetical protein MUC44_05320 [Beijerinckiaceae bacterium]|nr:hypothetical protein [Beijerinckiaceae bacterium]